MMSVLRVGENAWRIKERSLKVNKGGSDSFHRWSSLLNLSKSSTLGQLGVLLFCISGLLVYLHAVSKTIVWGQAQRIGDRILTNLKIRSRISYILTK